MCEILMTLVILVAAVYIAVTRSMVKKKEGKIFVHIRTGNRYRMEGICKIKIGDEWRTAISYINPKEKKVYVREIADFNSKFVSLEEWRKKQWKQ